MPLDLAVVTVLIIFFCDDEATTLFFFCLDELAFMLSAARANPHPFFLSIVMAIALAPDTWVTGNKRSSVPICWCGPDIYFINLRDSFIETPSEWHSSSTSPKSRVERKWNEPLKAETCLIGCIGASYSVTTLLTVSKVEENSAIYTLRRPVRFCFALVNQFLHIRIYSGVWSI